MIVPTLEELAIGSVHAVDWFQYNKARATLNIRVTQRLKTPACEEGVMPVVEVYYRPYGMRKEPRYSLSFDEPTYEHFLSTFIEDDHNEINHLRLEIFEPHKQARQALVNLSSMNHPLCLRSKDGLRELDA